MGVEMRVLVTGASGFVGGAVVRVLRVAGHESVGLVRRPGRPGDYVGDMRDPATYVPLVREVDAVVHAAQLGIRGRLTPRRSARLFAADAVHHASRSTVITY